MSPWELGERLEHDRQVHVPLRATSLNDSDSIIAHQTHTAHCRLGASVASDGVDGVIWGEPLEKAFSGIQASVTGLEGKPSSRDMLL
jgi:hypothetical protein